MKYYGCGSPIPHALEGLKALDVGCGTGRDVYILSRLAGENGFAWGGGCIIRTLNVSPERQDLSIQG
ncbi:MAG: hypothetical protein J7K30_04670 [Deltaproteobacteria bacterium]|nr:hypothetical protein [Deltaproteobacteria bacterium]